MEKLKTVWNYTKVLTLVVLVSLGAHKLGQHKTELKYQSILNQQKVEQELQEVQLKTEKELAEKQELVQEKEQLVEKTELLQKEVEKVKVKITPSEMINVKKYYLLLKHGDGRYELRTGGSPSWRYNNPGKLAFGNYAKMAGAIGKDGPLAIFPDYETGKNAFESYLFETDVYKGMSVSKMVYKFAQVKDGYDPKKYLEAITKNANYKAGTLLSDFTADERAELIEKIQEQENWVAGNIRPFENEEDFEKNGY